MFVYCSNFTNIEMNMDLQRLQLYMYGINVIKKIEIYIIKYFKFIMYPELDSGSCIVVNL